MALTWLFVLITVFAGLAMVWLLAAILASPLIFSPNKRGESRRIKVSTGIGAGLLLSMVLALVMMWVQRDLGAKALLWWLIPLAGIVALVFTLKEKKRK